MKYHTIGNNGIAINLEQIHPERYEALRIAHEIGGELLFLYSNAVVFYDTTIEQIENLLPSKTPTT